MSMLKTIKKPKYEDGRTKQAFKDATDVNKILARAQVQGGLSHALKYGEAEYGELANIDLLDAHKRITLAKEIFSELPSEVRKEFNHDALKYAAYASDPENVNRLKELIPRIAEPDRFFPSPVRRAESVEVVPVPVPGTEPAAVADPAPEV